MKHKPFEEWIFNEKPSNVKEKKALYEHLRECDDCYLLEKNWRSVEHLLTNTPLPRPADGFSERWQARLEANNRRAVQKQAWIMLFSTGFAAAFFLIMFGVQLFQQISQAMVSGLTWLSSATGLVSVLRNATEIFVELTGVIPPLLPYLVVMGFFAAVGALAILWLKMLRTLARYQGYYQWA